MYQSSFFPPIAFLFLFFPNTFFNLSRFIIFVTKIRGSRIESKIVWRDSADLNVGWVSIKVKWRNAKTRNFFFFWKKQRTFIPPVLLLKWLFDTHERKHLILFRRKKNNVVLWTQFYFCVLKMLAFLKQDCGKGKPWNLLAKAAIQSMSHKQFSALSEKWQDLHLGLDFYSQKLPCAHG